MQLLQPLFVEAPPEQPEQMLAALRALFRDHLEERLASGRESSVHLSSMPGDAVATYVRISTDETMQPHSLAAQAQRLDAFAQSQE